MVPDGLGDALADAVVWLAVVIVEYMLATIIFTGVGLGLTIGGGVKKKKKLWITGIVFDVIGVGMLVAGIVWYVLSVL
jgi:hypothetical protein